MEYSNGKYRDVAVYNLNEQSRSLPLADHFVLGEFACKDGTPVVLVHPGLPVLLEHIHERMTVVYGATVVIGLTNGYRTPAHNASVGGASNSRHLFGFAADIKVYFTDGDGNKQQVPPDEVATYAESIGAGGVGRYDTFTHVDVFGENRRWDERTNAKRKP